MSKVEDTCKYNCKIIVARGGFGPSDSCQIKLFQVIVVREVLHLSKLHLHLKDYVHNCHRSPCRNITIKY